MLLNGPESFTPDGNFILGEAPELRGYFVCAGFNSAGIANSGGAGRLIAEWIVGGEPPRDLWDVDIRRFGAVHTPTARQLAERTVETLGLHYAMRWPRQELETARPLRRSPLYDLLRAQGRGVRHARSTGSAPTTSAPRRRARRAPHTLGTPGWLPCVLDEQRATPRGGRALRPDLVRQARCCRAATRSRVLQRLCANEIDVAVGPHGLHARCSTSAAASRATSPITRLAADRFLIVTGSAQATRDARLDRAPHRRRRARGARRRHARCTRCSR